MSVAQVVLSGFVLFGLYKFLLGTIGVEQLGVWSVVAAAIFVTKISDLGLSGSVVKFVAKYSARNETGSLVHVIQTSVISMAALTIVAIVALYPLFVAALKFLVPSDQIANALLILPLVAVGLWFSVVAGVILGALDGFQRFDLRTGIQMASMLLNFGLVVLLVPGMGLQGLAYSQLVQLVFQSVAGWIILRRQTTGLPLLPRAWSRPIFVEMISYGVNFQVASVARMLCDPITKAMLSKFGSVSMVGYYEMANRMIEQFRAIIVAANQVLVPVIAEVQENDPSQIRNIYRNSCRVVVFLAIPFMSMVAAAIPLISLLWIGELQDTFILFSFILIAGHIVSIMGGPAYFANLGVGRLKWNTVAIVVLGILNLAMGALLGSIYGGIGVVLAWTISLVVAHVLMVIAFHVSNGVPIIDVFPVENVWIALTAMLCLAGSSALFQLMDGRSGLFLTAILILVLCASLFLIPVWKHPMRVRLISLVFAPKGA